VAALARIQSAPSRFDRSCRLFNRDVLTRHAEFLSQSLGLGPPTRLSIRTTPAKRSESINDGPFTAERVVKQLGVFAVKGAEHAVDPAFISLDGSCDIRAAL